MAVAGFGAAVMLTTVSNWVFYTRSLHIFQRKFNEILAPLPAMPLTFRAEEDPQWEEYHEMSQCEVTVIDSN